MPLNPEVPPLRSGKKLGLLRPSAPVDTSGHCFPAHAIDGIARLDPALGIAAELDQPFGQGGPKGLGNRLANLFDVDTLYAFEVPNQCVIRYLDHRDSLPNVGLVRFGELHGGLVDGAPKLLLLFAASPGLIAQLALQPLDASVLGRGFQEFLRHPR